MPDISRRLLLPIALFVALLRPMANSAPQFPHPPQPSVQLMVEGDWFEPATTLEIRFPADMVSSEQLGIALEDSPLRFTPPVSGKFTWLSKRSGVYLPDAPPKMGTSFALTLKPGLTDASQHPVPPNFKAQLKTPAFGVSHAPANEPDSAGLASDAEIRMAFNRNVEIRGTESLFRFVNDQGKSVAAIVRYANRRRDYFQIDATGEDWETRWKQALHPEPTTEPDEDEDGAVEPDAADKSAAQPNRLVIKPAEPLTPGTPWRLELRAGLKAVTGGYSLSKSQSFPLGAVAPFRVRAVTPSSYLNSGRSVEVDLTGSLAPDVTEESAGQFFRVIPQPAELQFEIAGTSVVIRGKFDRDTVYRLDVSESLLSSSALPISGNRSHPIKFAPVKPRIYLPKITSHQVLGGLRKFPALSVNLKTLHVRALLVEPIQAAHAIGAFSKYEKEYDEKNPAETYQPLPAGLIQGTTLFDKDVPLGPSNLDARQETSLSWDEILGDKRAGVIFLTIEGTPVDGLGRQRPAAQCLIQLTDLGILWKKTSEGLNTSVFSMANGKPLEGTQLTLLDENYKPTSTARTDATGNAQIRIGAEPAWLLAQNGSDAHALRMGAAAQELPMAAFEVPIAYGDWATKEEADGPPLRALLFTDRPLYRPGERVHVKGIVRYVGASGLAAESNRDGILKLSIPHSPEKEFKIHTDQAGSFDTELSLDASTTGGYALQLKFGNREGDWWQNGFRAYFQVADFQPNAFEIVLSAPSRFEPASEVVVDVSGKYFFGGSLGAAHATWTLQYAPATFSAAGFETFTFGPDDAPREKTLHLHGNAELSGTGTLSMRPKLPELRDGPVAGHLTLEVTDLNQQTVTESRSFTRDSASFYIGMKAPEDRVIGHKQDIAARIVALTPDGQPLATPVPVTIELVRIRYDTVRVQGAGKAVGFRSEQHEEVVESVQKQTMVPVRTGTTWELPPTDSARFTPGKAGRYVLRATATDSKGRKSVAGFGFSVSGSEPISWDYRNPAQIDLIPGKLKYRSGETARILVKTPFAGEALVTIERQSQILRTMRVKLEGNAPTLEIPLQPGDAPNVFVSVMLIRGADASTRKFPVPEYRYGVCQLRINSPESLLNVTIKPESSRVEPGQEISAAVQVHDGTGAAVANAEVTFYAVDDGILALTGYERPQPSPIFGAPFPLGIRTGITLYELFPEDPADFQFGNKGYLIGGGGGDGQGPKVRHDFPGTACWFPSLRTDAQGNLTVRFKAPDALTRYRLVAVAHAQSSQFGSGESAVEIRKPFLIFSALGQGANQGDEILARAVVRNETGSAGTVEVSLTLDATGEAAGKPLNANLSLKDGDSGTVDIPVRLRAMGSARWQWTAKLKTQDRTFEDALTASLKIGSPVPLFRETYLTDLSGKSNDLLAGVNPQLLEGTGSVNVTLSNTRLASLRQSAKQLLEYPYGCAEQTVSALIPWIVINELGPVLPDLAASKADIRKTVDAGIARLFAQQTSSGGLAYWPGGREPNFFASAYGALALGILQKQGTPAPGGWPKLLGYLSGELRTMNQKHPKHSRDEFALALLALATADAPEPAYHEQLFARRAELSMEGRALLACAIIQAKGKTGPVARLLDPTAAVPESFSWFGSATRERAVCLMAWTWYKPEDREIERLTKEILAARVNGHWRTTQENAWAMLALSRYFTTVERKISPVNATLAKAATEVPVALDTKTLSKSLQFAFDPAAPLGALNVANPQAANLYAETQFEVRPPVAAQPRQSRGYAVSRAYRKLGADGALTEPTGLRVGDRVLVTLQIETTRPGHFVAVDDPLPALLEAINPEFRTQASGGAARERSWAADYREIRADRVLYFCDHLPAGSFTFQYLARVRTAGRATAPATKVEEMYRPERFGLSATTQLEAAAR